LNDDMRRLVRLQDIAFQIRDLEQTEATLPDRMATLERAFQERIEEIGSARLRHEDLVQQQRRLNTEREDIQERLRLAQQKLMHVNNQREYSAVLNEIDSYKSGLTGTEDRILDCESQIESLAGAAAEADERIAEERRKLEESKSVLNGERDTCSERLLSLNSQRDELGSHLPVDVLRRFDSIFRARGGIAMARVEKESCGACHVRLRPQIINLARRGDQMVTCDSCRRILYIDDTDQDPMPAGDPRTPEPAGLRTPRGAEARG
jgi:uncharacterized protein